MNGDEKTDRSELSAFLDGQLPPEEAERMAEALLHDPELRAEMEALEATGELLAALPRVSAPEGLLDTVMEQVERKRLLHAAEPVGQAKPLRWIRHFSRAAIVLLTIGLGMILYNVLSDPGWVDEQERSRGGVSQLARSDERSAPKPDASPSRVERKERSAPKRTLANRAAPVDVDDTVAEAEAPVGAQRGVAYERAAKGAPIRGLPERPAEPGVVASKEGLGRNDRAGYLTRGREQALALAQRRQRLRVGRSGGGGYGGPVGGTGPAEQPRAASVFGQARIGTEVVVLTTSDVRETTQRVRNLLISNDIHPMARIVTNIEIPRFTARQSRMNVFQSTQWRDGTKVVAFHVDEDHAPALIAQLRALVQPAPTAFGEVIAGLPLSAGGSGGGSGVASAGAEVRRFMGDLQFDGLAAKPSPPMAHGYVAPADQLEAGRESEQFDLLQNETAAAEQAPTTMPVCGMPFRPMTSTAPAPRLGALVQVVVTINKAPDPPATTQPTPTSAPATRQD